MPTIEPALLIPVENQVRELDAKLLLACVAALLEAPGGSERKLHHVLSALVGEGEAVRVVYTTGHWLDVDTVDDLVAAGGFGA